MRLEKVNIRSFSLPQLFENVTELRCRAEGPFIFNHSQIQPSLVAKEHNVLVDANLVAKEKIGKTTLYEISPKRYQKVQELLGSKED